MVNMLKTHVGQRRFNSGRIQMILWASNVSGSVGTFGILEVGTVSGILSQFEEEISQRLMIWGQWSSSQEEKMTNHAFRDLV